MHRRVLQALAWEGGTPQDVADRINLGRHEVEDTLIDLRRLGLVSVRGARRADLDTLTFWTLTELGQAELTQ
jgi:DNA-binding IclR family transcriptional regulator